MPGTTSKTIRTTDCRASTLSASFSRAEGCPGRPDDSAGTSRCRAGREGRAARRGRRAVAPALPHRPAARLPAESRGAARRLPAKATGGEATTRGRGAAGGVWSRTAGRGRGGGGRPQWPARPHRSAPSTGTLAPVRGRTPPTRPRTTHPPVGATRTPPEGQRRRRHTTDHRQPYDNRTHPAPLLRHVDRVPVRLHARRGDHLDIHPPRLHLRRHRHRQQGVRGVVEAAGDRDQRYVDVHRAHAHHHP